MQCYASHTHNRRNLATLRAAGWRMLISRARPDGKPEGMSYGLDNGAWSDFRNGRSFDDVGFQTLVDRLGREADWVIAPDIVEGGLDSLRLSLVWLAPLLDRTRMVLVPVQDGMEPAHLLNIVMPKRIGIFLGGSTEWKLARMVEWGQWCAERGVYYHVGRVNTIRRFRLAHIAGADSVDGSSASRYSVTLPPLDFAARQWDMWAPPKILDEQIAWAAAPAEVAT